MPECTLCCDEKTLMTVGECEHPFVCLDCTYKCRSVNGNIRCLHCNQELKQVAVIEDVDTPFSSLSLVSTEEFKSGIFYTSQKTKSACYALEEAKCPIAKCGKKFTDMNHLKKHLKEKHKRTYCEICLQNQTLLLSEQKVYRFPDHHEHLTQGDCDEDDNIVLYHPLCPFCNIRFFNEDAFLIHMKGEHIRCNLCNLKENPHVYYKNEQSLRIHHEKSHFACSYQECSKVAFKTKEELENHINKVHLRNNSKKGVISFNSKEEKFVMKDNEGKNVSKEVN